MYDIQAAESNVKPLLEVAPTTVAQKQLNVFLKLRVYTESACCYYLFTILDSVMLLVAMRMSRVVICPHSQKCCHPVNISSCDRP